MRSSDIHFEYAAVNLLDAPYFIDNQFDYFIPLELRGEIEVGSFVTVPFGRGNRGRMAVVRQLHHVPNEKEREIKTISLLCLDRPTVSLEMLNLCDYMKAQYLCTFGEALRCMIPASALGKMTEYYSPTSGKGPNASAGFAPADLFVYEYILTAGGRSADAVKTKFGGSVAGESLKKLLSKGYLKRELLSSRTMSEAFENHYTLALPKEEIFSIVNGEGSVKLRSESHKGILRRLSEAEVSMTAPELEAACGATAAQMKALVEKGLVAVERRRVWRQSYQVEKTEAKPFTLNQEQVLAAETIKDRMNEGTASALLLHGVTGSGKTSVIITAIDHALKCNKGVIMLLPEIALTPQTLKIFSSRYGDRIALVHSGLSAGERYDAYMKLQSGQATLCIGTRSAIFSPVQNLGLVIIDEEHETTYKSDTSPKYHARDIARWRCANSNAVLLLSSATPAIESYTKAMEGKYTLLKLTQRYGDAVLPDVVVYDMRNEVRNGNSSPIGRLLRDKLKAVADRGEQSVLFLNRRGYNTAVGCKSCGETLTCPHCSISLNYHTKKGSYQSGFLFCHWCGYKTSLPEKCPSCGSEHLVKTGFGTQKIEQELSELLPDKKILRMDADSTAQKHSLEEILTDFKEKRGDLLLGTQMVTKGHDFPNVTLVGVLLADMSLYMDDYHANERTFSMLTQVIGRAGRSEKKGLAVIQTNNPDNDIIRMACNQDYESFYRSEIRLRKLLVFPPYCDIVLLTLTCTDEKQVLVAASRFRQELDNKAKNAFSDVEMIIFGPFESPVYKVEEKYRMRLVVKCRLNKRSRLLFSELLSGFSRNSKEKITLSIDFNPSGL